MVPCDLWGDSKQLLKGKIKCFLIFIIIRFKVLKLLFGERVACDSIALQTLGRGRHLLAQHLNYSTQQVDYASHVLRLPPSPHPFLGEGGWLVWELLPRFLSAYVGLVL